MSFPVDKIYLQQPLLVHHSPPYPKRQTKKGIITTVEAVVVGGGFSGAYTGYHLAQRGINAAIVESPLDTDCQNSITVSQNDIGVFDLNHLSSTKKTVCPAQILSPGGKRFIPSKQEHLFSFKENYLTKEFLQKSRDKGCRVFNEQILGIEHENGGWAVHTSNRLLRCRVLIAADAQGKMVKKAITLNPQKETAVFGTGYSFYNKGHSHNFLKILDCGEVFKVWCDEEMLHAELFGSLPTGYGRRKRLETLMRELLGNMDFSSTWTSVFPDIYNPAFFEKPCSGKNWILTASAAGHVHPIGCEGGLFALASAELAAKAIEWGDPRIYDSLWRDCYGKTVATAAKLKNYLHSPTIANTLFAAAYKSKSLSDLISPLLTPSLWAKKSCSHTKRLLRIMLEFAK